MAHYICKECGEQIDLEFFGSVMVCPCCGSDDFELVEDEIN